MNRVSVRVNFLFNLLNKSLAILIPLIITPYVTRIFSAERLGIYTYTSTVASYFVTFILMGIGMYGSRLISQTKDEKLEFEKSYSTLFTVQVINSIFAILAYILYLSFWDVDNKAIFMIQILYVISASFDISWFFSGLENFKVMSVRNIIINILSVMFIFLFVKSEGDLWIYTLIKAGSSLVSAAYLAIPFLAKYKYRLPSLKDLAKVYRGLLVLFIPVLADTIFQTIDKVMLATTSYRNVGLYYSSRMITDIPQTVVTSLNVILFPRITSLLIEKNEQRAISIFRSSFVLIIGLCIAMAFGISAISVDFVKLFFGASYIEVASFLPTLVVYICLAAWSGTLRYQYLLPRSLEKIYVRAIVIGIFVNVVFNYFMIPRFGVMGAIYATLLAEFIICLYETYPIRREIFKKDIILNIGVFFSLSAIMYFAVKFCRDILVERVSLFSLVIIELLIGGIVFSTLLGVYLAINRKLMKNFRKIFR